MDGRRAPYGRCRLIAAVWTPPRACQALSRSTRCVDRLVPVSPATRVSPGSPTWQLHQVDASVDDGGVASGATIEPPRLHRGRREWCRFPRGSPPNVTAHQRGRDPPRSSRPHPQYSGHAARGARSAATPPATPLSPAASLLARTAHPATGAPPPGWPPRPHPSSTPPAPPTNAAPG